jgi:hypothetical protein
MAEMSQHPTDCRRTTYAWTTVAFQLVFVYCMLSQQEAAKGSLGELGERPGVPQSCTKRMRANTLRGEHACSKR